jgi:hypothetical protein
MFDRDKLSKDFLALIAAQDTLDKIRKYIEDNNSSEPYAIDVIYNQEQIDAYIKDKQAKADARIILQQQYDQALQEFRNQLYLVQEQIDYQAIWYNLHFGLAMMGYDKYLYYMSFVDLANEIMAQDRNKLKRLG